MAHYALEAAEPVAEDGIGVEVVDLRTLRPLDRETVLVVGAQDRQVPRSSTRTTGSAATARRSPRSSPRRRSTTSTARSSASPGRTCRACPTTTCSRTGSCSAPKDRRRDPKLAAYETIGRRPARPTGPIGIDHSDRSHTLATCRVARCPSRRRVDRGAHPRRRVGGREPTPSGMELGRSFEVSRSTLRLALAELEERGLITRDQGRGTFVARPRVQAEIGGHFSLRDALRARGIRLENPRARGGGGRGLLVAWPGVRTAARRPGLVRIDRLRSTEGEPLVIDSAQLPADRFPGLEYEGPGDDALLYDILRDDYGCRVATAAETLEPVIMTTHECALLGVPANAPAFSIRRLTRDREDAIVEFATALLRGDRARLLLQRRSAETWFESVA